MTTQKNLINVAEHDSAYGSMLLVSTEKGLSALFFLSCGVSRENLLARLVQQHQLKLDNELVYNTKPVKLFQQWLDSGQAPLDLLGTPFQLKVWQALLTIPQGQTRSYQQIAQQINRPKAVRAVGTAIGKNPVSWIVPCHRVVRSNGQVGQYYWGSKLKQQLLQHESANAVQQAS